MAHSYSHLYGIPSTGLRFFTVYGPWGRPDMAPMLFTKAILENEPIKVFNHGNMFRDFTYIDDVVEIISRLLQKPAIPNINFDKEEPEPATSWAPHMIFNVGNNKPITLKQFIQAIEKELNKEAKKEFLDMQKGDVVGTYCNNTLISNWIEYRPKTLLDKGIKEFINWYKSYYHHE